MEIFAKPTLEAYDESDYSLTSYGLHCVGQFTYERALFAMGLDH